MHRGTSRRIRALLLGAAVLFAAAIASAQVAPRITQPIDNSVRQAVSGTVHPLANAANDRGRADGSLAMTDMILTLRPAAAQQAALDKLSDDLHNPSSASYHRWLTPAQFGPSTASPTKM